MKIGTFDRDWPALLKTIKNRVVAVPGNHDMGNALIGDNTVPAGLKAISRPARGSTWPDTPTATIATPIGA